MKKNKTNLKNKMILDPQKLEELYNAIRDAGGCNIQYDGWTCGTCFFAISEKFTNKDWQTMLAVRGDTELKELNNLPKNIEKQVERIIQIAKKNKI